MGAALYPCLPPQREDSSHSCPVPLWTFLGCSGTLPWSASLRTTSCRGMSTSPSPPASLTWVSAGLFLSRVLTPLSSCNFLSCSFPLPLWSTPEVLPLSLGLAISQAAGAPWSQLALAPLDTGETSSSFSQKPP